MAEVVNEVFPIINTYLKDPDGQSEKLVEALERLKGLEMSLKILKETQIGRTLTKLSKHIKDQSLNDAIASLLISWKDLAKKQISTEDEKIVDKRDEEVKNTTVLPVADNSSNKKRRIMNDQSASEMAKKRTVAECVLPEDTRRAGMVKKLAEKLSLADGSLFEQAGKTALEIALRVEEVIYSSISDPEHYFEQCQSLRFNLGANSKLRSEIIREAVPLKSLATMTNEEMASDEIKRNREMLIEENEAKHQTERLTPNCHTEPCPKCHSRKVYNRSAQTRSADEPMTQFYTCLSCEKRWKT